MLAASEAVRPAEEVPQQVVPGSVIVGSNNTWIANNHSGTYIAIACVAKYTCQLLTLLRANKLRTLDNEMFVGAGRFLAMQESLDIFPQSTREIFLEIFFWADGRVNPCTIKFKELVLTSNLQVKLVGSIDKLYSTFYNYVTTVCVGQDKCDVFGVSPEDKFIPFRKKPEVEDGKILPYFPFSRQELPRATEEGSETWVHDAFIRKGAYKVSGRARRSLASAREALARLSRERKYDFIGY